MHPLEDDLHALQAILDISGKASDWITNLSKSDALPIRCGQLNLDEVLRPFPGQRKVFHCKYLALPMHTRKLCKIYIQPLIDKFGAKLPGGKVDCSQD